MSEKYLPHYAYYPRDFQTKTRHLSLIEKACFRELMDEMWITDQDEVAIPDDHDYCAGVCGLSVDAWIPIRKKLVDGARPVLRRFKGTDGQWYLTSNRLQEELEKARGLSKAGAAGGIASGEARRKKSPKSEKRTTVEPPLNDRSTTDERRLNHTDTEPEETKKEKLSTRARAGSEEPEKPPVSPAKFDLLADRALKLLKKHGVRDLEVKDPDAYAQAFEEEVGVPVEFYNRCREYYARGSPA